MSLRMELTLAPRIEQRQELTLDLLTPNDREKLLLAQRLWEIKPHVSVSLPIAILEGVVTEGIQGKLPPEPGLNRAGALVEEFAFIAPKEMASLDEEEKIGLKLGDCVFVTRGTPEDYVPLVVLNLAMHRHLREENPISRLLEKSGIDFAHARHWTANIFDVLLAERFFEEQEGEFDRYLEWRKSVERTKCFQNELVDEILRGRVSRSDYRKKTHPLDRGRYARHSWKMSSCLDHAMGVSQADRCYRDFGVSRCDLLFNRMASQPKFDPDKMMQLLQCVRDQSFTIQERGRLSRRVVLDSDLEVQAYLLTEDVSHGASILEYRGRGLYVLKLHAHKTVNALIDKLAYFFRHAIGSLQGERSEIRGQLLSMLGTEAQQKD